MISPDRLAVLPLLRGASVGVVAALASRAVERRYATGETIFAAGSAPRGLFIVLDGRVRVVRSRGGRQHVVHEERAGGTLGEVPLFAGGEYPATAVAAEPTRCAVLDRDALVGAIAQHPEAALLFLERLARRVRHLVDRLDDRSAAKVSSRLARWLLGRRRDDAQRIVALGMTQGALAEELGTVREVLARELRALQAAGAIRSLGAGRYEIADRVELEAIAGE